MERPIIIGTRGSDLALWQANYTKSLLEAKGHAVELKIIQTSGDRTQQWETSFDKLEGKGFFTKELEEALLKKEIDMAVHSHKDVPTENPPGLLIAGVSHREDPSELLIIRKEHVDDKKKFSLKAGAIVGTSSARRKSQLLAFRPDIQIKDMRGNVPTRIQKLRDGQYDAILLAAAGVERLQLNLEDLHTELLNPREFIPAPAQGVLAWQVREDDMKLMDVIDEISNFDVRVRINLEREVLNLFEGGCQLPLGVYCETEEDDDRLKFKLWVSHADHATAQPRQLCFETLDTDGFADMVVEHIKHIKARKVFITRPSAEGDYFYDALARLGFAVEGKSLIEFKPIRFTKVPEAEWIFFSSKHAVKYFFLQKPELGKVKFGCIGTGTSAALRAYGHRADFIGQSTDTKLVGKQFGAKAGAGKILFPIARGSMQTVQWQIPKRDNVINLEVYATLKHSVEINPETEVVVFTSPSNVEAFFEKNKLAPHQKAVAMGEATGQALDKLKIKNYTLPPTFDDLGLVQAVMMVSR